MGTKQYFWLLFELEEVGEGLLCILCNLIEQYCCILPHFSSVSQKITKSVLRNICGLFCFILKKEVEIKRSEIERIHARVFWPWVLA